MATLKVRHTLRVHAGAVQVAFLGEQNRIVVRWFSQRAEEGMRRIRSRKEVFAEEVKDQLVAIDLFRRAKKHQILAIGQILCEAIARGRRHAEAAIRGDQALDMTRLTHPLAAMFVGISRPNEVHVVGTDEFFEIERRR